MESRDTYCLNYVGVGPLARCAEEFNYILGFEGKGINVPKVQSLALEAFGGYISRVVDGDIGPKYRPCLNTMGLASLSLHTKTPTLDRPMENLPLQIHIRALSFGQVR